MIMRNKREENSMRVTYDPEQLILFSRMGTDKRCIGITDQSFHERLLAKYRRTCHFFKFHLYFLNLPLRLEYQVRKIFSPVVHISKISFSYFYAKILRNPISVRLPRIVDGRTEKRASDLFSEYSPLSDFSHKPASRTKSPQISAIAKFFKSSVIYDRLDSFLKPLFIEVPASRPPSHMGFSYSQVESPSAIHFIGSQRVIAQVLSKREIKSLERWGSAKPPGTLFFSSFRSTAELIFREKKPQILRSSIDRSGLERDFPEPGSAQSSSLAKFYQHSATYDKIVPFLKGHFTRFPLLSQHGQIKSLLEVGEPYLARRFTRGLLTSGRFLLEHEISVSDAPTSTRYSSGLSHSFPKTGLMSRRYNSRMEDSRPKSTSFLDNEFYPNQTRSLDEGVDTKTIDKALEVPAIGREKGKILRSKKFIDSAHLVHHPAYKSRFQSGDDSASVYRDKLTEIVHFSKHRYPGSSYIPKLEDAKGKEHFSDISKADIRRPFTVPEAALPGLANRVYEIILERVKREKGMRGR
jgi:hypothetical protein